MQTNIILNLCPLDMRLWTKRKLGEYSTRHAFADIIASSSIDLPNIPDLHSLRAMPHAGPVLEVYKACNIPEDDFSEAHDVDERKAFSCQFRVHRHVGLSISTKQPESQRRRQAHEQRGTQGTQVIRLQGRTER